MKEVKFDKLMLFTAVVCFAAAWTLFFVEGMAEDKLFASFGWVMAGLSYIALALLDKAYRMKDELIDDALQLIHKMAKLLREEVMKEMKK